MKPYSIQQYPALFSILGIRFGGDGKSTFNVPNLQGQVPFGLQAANAPIVESGEECIVLSSIQIPVHSHSLNAVIRTVANANLATNVPSDKIVLSNAAQTGTTTVNIAAFSSQVPSLNMGNHSIANAGLVSPSAHENRMPYLPMTYCICYDGQYPLRP